MGMNGGIGFNGQLPWKNSVDMKYFKMTTSSCNKTKQNAVIMGHKTFESLNFKPLPNRLNICISTTQYSNILVFPSLDDALNYLYKLTDIEKIFVIGGARLYNEAICHKDCNELIVNEIDCQVDCDVFFPEIDTKYGLVETRTLSNDVHNRRYIRE